MTKAPQTDLAGNFSETVAQEVQYLIRRLAKPGKNLIEKVISEISCTNPVTLLGTAKIGQLLLFLKDKLKPKQYEEALVNSLGWISSITNRRGRVHELIK